MESGGGGKNLDRHNETEDEKIIEIEPLEDQKTVELSNIVIREKIALRLTLMVSCIVLVTILAVALSGTNAAAIKDVAITVIPELIVILGTIVGFYFGSRK